jgi:hypothetical protein
MTAHIECGAPFCPLVGHAVIVLDADRDVFTRREIERAIVVHLKKPIGDERVAGGDHARAVCKNIARQSTASARRRPPEGRKNFV